MTETELARVIAGETGNGLCGITAMILIAHMLMDGRNTVWYGDADPSPLAEFVAMFWWLMPDPAPDAHYLFSRQDLALPAVRRIIGNKDPTLVVECDGGLGLYAYP